jgi:hypothetical protein
MFSLEKRRSRIDDEKHTKTNCKIDSLVSDDKFIETS